MNLFTQQDLEDFFRTLGIERGMTVLLQANLEKETILHDYSALIEALNQILSPGGLLIVPGFTLQALDPASRYSSFPMQLHETIRLRHPGFSSKMTVPDCYEKSAAALMLHTKARRSEHPVFSFFWLGASAAKPTLSDLDYPLSYRHVLSAMKQPHAVNLLIDIPLEQAIFPLLEAHEQNQDVLEVLSCYYRRVGRSFPASFCSSYLDRESLDSLLSSFQIRKERLGRLQVTALSLKQDSR